MLPMNERSRMSPEQNVEILNETLHIMRKGHYKLEEERVQLKLSANRRRWAKVYTAREVAAMREHPKGGGSVVLGRCRYSVVNQGSYELARDLTRLQINSKKPVLVLNFANPVSPGGGVRRGANAQEEDLCRKSSLLLSLESKAAALYYEAHKKLGSWLASDAMILTPEVEIIRGGDNELLPETTVVAVLTCAAPAISMLRQPVEKSGLERLLYDRIMGMLQVAAHEAYDYIVLGAWGCGAFGNDPELMSDLFYKALKDFRYGKLKEKDTFTHIAFAVLDRSVEKRNLKAFQRNFDRFYRDEDDAEREEVLKRIKGTEVHLDSIRGSLYGGAVGDALGYPVEFFTWEMIRDKYGAGGIQDYVLDAGCGKALISDDTQMTLFTICGLLHGQTRGNLRGIAAHPSAYIHRAYLDWYKTQTGKAPDFSVSWILSCQELYSRRAPGNTCLSALESGVMGSTAQRINNSKGCGGVMRVAPLGLSCPDWKGKQLKVLDKEGAEVAAITHGHPLGFIPAAFLTHVIHQAAFYKGEYAGLRAIVEEALKVTGELFGEEPQLGSFEELIDRAVKCTQNGESDADNIHTLGGGWVAEEAVAIAVYCVLKYEGDFSKALIASVNHSGDSDSTGAITGNILGAWLGYEAIEEKWKQNLELSDVILELADDLCHGCQMEEYSSYTDEDWVRKYVSGSYFDINRFLRGF